jgi:hypothetical protein
MRAVILVLAAGAVVTPGVALAAQLPPAVGIAQARDAEFAAQAASARARDVAVTNERSAQDARLATDQALRDLPAIRPAPPVVLANPRSPSPAFDASAFVSIPDAKLAASNAAVRAAAGNRR